MLVSIQCFNRDGTITEIAFNMNSDRIDLSKFLDLERLKYGIHHELDLRQKQKMLILNQRHNKRYEKSSNARWTVE